MKLLVESLLFQDEYREHIPLSSQPALSSMTLFEDMKC